MKNKTRVQELAEVYTNNREVNAMLDLPKDLRYNSTFLEPGCGNGNFIVEILNRKFQLVKNLQEVKHLKKLKIFDEFEFKLLLSISSIYGIDIDNENIMECRDRSMKLIDKLYSQYLKKEMGDDFRKSINYILNKNIIYGDFLNETNQISISEFSEFRGNQIQETKFYLNNLLFPDDEIFSNENKLFGHIPKYYQKYNPVEYYRIYNNDSN